MHTTYYISRDLHGGLAGAGSCKRCCFYDSDKLYNLITVHLTKAVNTRMLAGDWEE